MSTQAGGVDYGNKKLQHVGREGESVGNITTRSLSTASNLVYTPQQFLSCLIKRDPNGAARTDTTPTAALLLSKFPDAVVGDYFDVDIINMGTGDAQNITIAAGTGITLRGETVIPQTCIAHMRCRFTSITLATAELFIAVSNSSSAITGKLKTKTPTAGVTYTITAGESGTTYFLAGAATTMKLPTPAAGLHYTFIVAGDLTGTWAINSTSDGSSSAALIFGSTANTPGTAGSTTGANAGTAVANMNFITAQDSTGDSGRLVCNGTNWYGISATSGIAAGMTFA